MPKETFTQSWKIVVIDGSEEHEVTVPARDVDHAKERAIAYCEHHYGTSWWRVHSVDGVVEPNR